MELKALIFDLDGVIVDTAHYHFLAWNRLANTWNYHIENHQNELLKGVNRMRSLELIAEWSGVQLTEADKNMYADKKNSWYLELIKTMKENDILPGVKQFLDQAVSRNLKVAVASASKNALEVLENIGLLDSFNYIADGNTVTESKPDPAVFLNVATHLQLKPQECIVFEDAPAGVEAALAGKFKVVGIGKKQALTHAHYVMPGFENISIDHILNSLSVNSGIIS